MRALYWAISWIISYCQLVTGFLTVKCKNKSSPSLRNLHLAVFLFACHIKLQNLALFSMDEWEEESRGRQKFSCEKIFVFKKIKFLLKWMTKLNCTAGTCKQFGSITSVGVTILSPGINSTFCLLFIVKVTPHCFILSRSDTEDLSCPSLWYPPTQLWLPQTRIPVGKLKHKGLFWSQLHSIRLLDVSPNKTIQWRRGDKQHINFTCRQEILDNPQVFSFLKQSLTHLVEIWYNSRNQMYYFWSVDQIYKVLLPEILMKIIVFYRWGRSRTIY